ncbi:MAG TPA: ATP-binding cassette domain-containing protein [Candidatus Bathyarchaeia archaeon]|nr:ATP-binding cassette domain-containing protein [Candidatus Bathyarchaeia archaeon]
MGSAIEAINLTKYYDDLLAVDHINFQVEQGEIFGFLGPNGAGKTTTIRMLTGISRPTEGTATIIGYDIQRQSVSAKEQMGIVPDVSNVYKDLSAWDNLVFTGKLYDMPKASRESRAEELLKMFGLYERRKEKVKGFSRGMKRRICIAMALMNRSRILFLDEPTSGLDVQSVLIIRDLIRKLNQQGLTIFITTHNIEEASQMCDRVAIINHGKIATIDTPEKLKRTMESLQSVEIAFEATPQNALKDLEELSQVSEVVKQGDKFKLFTRDPSSVLTSTWNYAQNNNLKLITVNTVGPSLEDVFVKLTGIEPAAAEEEPEKMGHGKAQRMSGRKEQQ